MNQASKARRIVADILMSSKVYMLIWQHIDQMKAEPHLKFEVSRQLRLLIDRLRGGGCEI